MIDVLKSQKRIVSKGIRKCSNCKIFRWKILFLTPKPLCEECYFDKEVAK